MPIRDELGLGELTGMSQTAGGVTRSVGYGYTNGDLASLTTTSGWFNNRRLLEPIGHVPPAEFEAEHYRQQSGLAIAA